MHMWDLSNLRVIFGRLVGVGEASFVSLAAPYILDVAPEGQVNNQLKLVFVPAMIQ